MAAVDEYGQLDGARAADVADGVQRSPHRATRVQDVVDEDHDPIVQPLVGQLGRLQGTRPAQADVVAVHRDVERADRDAG